MALQEQVYSDFSGGFNDSVAAISIKDTEVCLSENADYSAEIKSFRSRKGCAKLNTVSFKTRLSLSQNAEVTDAHVWSIGSKYKKAVVIGSKLYDYDESADTLTEKISLTAGATEIYPFVLFNKFYFGDGSQLYVWGDFDLASEVSEGGATKDVAVGEIVRNDNSTAGSSVLGHFYQCKTAQTAINLATTDYSNTANWTDVTEVPYFASNVCRVLSAFDPSEKEVVRIAVHSGASASGTVTIYLDGSAFTVSITANSTVDTVVNAIVATTFTGWTVAKSDDGFAAIFTKNTAGLSANGYVDPGTTGCSMTYTTVTEGKTNDNDIAPIKKCTMFLVHTSSSRVFAAGNPDDNAVFYSEIGNAAYWKSSVDKVYAVNSYGKPTGMLQLSESVLISFEDGWYAWNGITPLEDATWKPLNLPYGCTCHRSIAQTPYSFMFLGRDGLYNISASILSTELVLLQGESVINKITKNKVDNTINSIYYKPSCTAIFYENTYYLAYNIRPPYFLSSETYAYGDYVYHNNKVYECINPSYVPREFNNSDWAQRPSAPNTRVLKYEWDTSSFTEVTGWKTYQWLSDVNGLMFASRNYLLVANVGTTDVNVDTGGTKDINVHIKTKEYHFGNPFVTKVTRVIGFIFKQTEELEDVDANVSIIMGYDSYDINTLEIDESLVWGSIWNKLWGFREAIVKMVELTMSSNTFQIDVRSTDPITLIAIGFVYETTDFVTPTLLKDEVLLT